MILIRARAAIGLLGCGTALLSVGCAQAVTPPPINITEYELACGSAATGYPVHVILLYNLQRTLDPDLAEHARLSSFCLVGRLREDRQEVRTCLALVLEDHGAPVELRRRVADYLLARKAEGASDRNEGERDMKPHLSGSHRRTYDAIFRHPAARNLGWRDVRSLLGTLAEVVEEPNGNLKIARNGQTLTLHPSLDKNVAEIEELMAIRHFLERSGAVAPKAVAEGVHLLVVIDHRQARVYRNEMRGSVPQRITPYDPGGFDRHLHNVQDDSNGQRKPERKSFYEAVAKTLKGAEQVLLFGGGTGASSAMEELLSQLKHHHGDLAKRVVGSVVLDETHLTEDQLLARAREFYTSIAQSGTTHHTERNQ